MTCGGPSILTAGAIPVVALSRPVLAQVLRYVLTATVTTTVRGVPTEVPLDGGDGMPRECVVNLNQVEAVSKGMLTERITALSEDRMHEVCRALRRCGRRPAADARDLAGRRPSPCSSLALAAHPAAPVDADDVVSAVPAGWEAEPTLVSKIGVHRAGEFVLVDGRDLSGSTHATAWLREPREDVEVLHLVGGESAVTPAAEAGLRVPLTDG